MKIIILLIIMTIFISCNNKILQFDSISVKDHNEVISLVIIDIFSDKNDIILGEPCLNGQLDFMSNTLLEKTFLMKEFEKANFGFSYSRIKLDSNFNKDQIPCKISLVQNKVLDKEKKQTNNYKGINLSSIVRGSTGKMAIFVWFSSGYDTHQAQYSVYKRNGKWEIEFDYSIDNAETWFGREGEVMDVLKQLKKERLRNE